MPPTDLESLSRSRVEPLIAVVDSCVFPRRVWLDPIVRGARSGAIVPIWSPLIISELNRLLTWTWLQRHQGELTTATWQACSADAKRWFTIMTAVFRVVDDCPPQEDAWDSPRDPWDVPIWSAAKRSGARIIVTANLRDGPPPDERGRQIFEGVVWCHPEVFARLIDLWADAVATGEREDAEDAAPIVPRTEASGSPAGLSASARPESSLALLLEVIDQASDRPRSEPIDTF
jgi:hypothetical protein